MHSDENGINSLIFDMARAIERGEDHTKYTEHIVGVVEQIEGQRKKAEASLASVTGSLSTAFIALSRANELLKDYAEPS